MFWSTAIMRDIDENVFIIFCVPKRMRGAKENPKNHLEETCGV